MAEHTGARHIMVVPFHGQGHVFPCVELCKRVATRGVAVTIVADHSISASLQKTAREARELSGLNISVLELPHPPDEEEEEQQQQQHPATEEGGHPAPDAQHPESFIDREAERMEEILRNMPTRPMCVIADVMVPWAAASCHKSGLPVASFFTSGACALAFEHAIWKYRSQVDKEKKPFAVPGFPPSMTVDPSDTHHGPPPGGPGGGPPPHGRHPGDRRGGRRGRGPPPRGRRPPPPPPPGGHGSNPPWMNEMKTSVAALVNTSRVLEAPFLDYVSTEIDKPSWAVGPLLPSSFWEGSSSATHDSTVRGTRESNVDEDRCLAWLDERAPRSVVYVSFGSEVGPSDEEITELALGLEAAEKPFILVLRDEYGADLPEGFEHRVEGRGLVIRGWAPQLLILSHVATGGFLSHCGWNSTVESLGHGVPLVAWPIRGDQHYNAKLLVKELGVAVMVSGDAESGMVRRESVVKGVKLLMESEKGDEMREKAKEIEGLLRSGREESLKEVDAFVDHMLGEAQVV